MTNQVFVEDARNLRILEFGELGEEGRRLIHVDAHVLASVLRDAHAHRRAKPGRRAVLEEPVDDDGVADQVEAAVDRIAGEPLSRALVQLEEDRKNSWSPEISSK